METQAAWQRMRAQKALLAVQDAVENALNCGVHEDDIRPNVEQMIEYWIGEHRLG